VSESGAVSANRAQCGAQHVLRMGHRSGAFRGCQSDVRHQAAQADQAHAGPERGRAGRRGDDAFGRMIKLLALTGQRRLETWSGRKSSQQRTQIELPSARTKNGCPHPARRASPGASGGPSTRWAARLRPERLPELGVQQEVAGQAHRRATWVAAAAWTIHDLRRSFATHVSELGFAPPFVVEPILNHISGSKANVAGVYNGATYLPEKRQALEQWAAYLLALSALRCPHNRARPERNRTRSAVS
jgi:integrase